MSETNPTEYYFNTKTNQVEEGKQSDWSHRIGPFDTHEEAAQALDKVASRNEAWENDDAQWEGKK